MKKKDFYLYIEGKRVKVSEEVYREYYKGERKERYFMRDLKTERVMIDPQSGEVTIIPGREDSYERLMESRSQFASYANMEEQTVQSLLLEQALGNLTDKERNLIEEIYFLEKTERQVSEALHIAKTTLRRKHREALSKRLRHGRDDCLQACTTEWREAVFPSAVCLSNKMTSKARAAIRRACKRRMAAPEPP